MTAGGIFPALLGTIWLVGVALSSSPCRWASQPRIYLSEYAPDNWLTRVINLAIINLAGVPSIVHALFGVGAFVLFFGFGTSILAASLTLAIMTLPSSSLPRGVAASGAAGLPRSLLEHGRHPLADHPPRGPAERHQRHPHRRHPRGVAHQRARRHPSCSPAPPSSCPSCPSVFDQTMALVAAPVRGLDPGAGRARSICPTAWRWC